MNYVIQYSDSVESAAKMLLEAPNRLLVVLDDENKVAGVVTQGNLRDANLHDRLESVMQRDFKFVMEGYDPSALAQIFDQKVHSVPVLSEDKRLLEVIDHSSIRGFGARSDLFYSRTPARVSLAGGGTDFTNFFTNHGGGGLCVAVNRYAYATLRVRQDKTITVTSQDTGEKFKVDSLSAIDTVGKLGIVVMAIKHVGPSFGFDLFISSEFPPGSGLGGSAAVVSSVLGVLLEAAGMSLRKEEIARAAFEIERVHLAIAGGWQDQYSTVFGGVCSLSYSDKAVVATPVKVDPAQRMAFESSAVMVHTGAAHHGQVVQISNARPKNHTPDEVAKGLELITQARLCFQRGSMSGLGKILSRSWEMKKAGNSIVSNPEIDSIYEHVMSDGAFGGKLLGTGGGGYFFFLMPVDKKQSIINRMTGRGLDAFSVSIDEFGLQAWEVR